MAMFMLPGLELKYQIAKAKSLPFKFEDSRYLFTVQWNMYLRAQSHLI